MQGREERLQVCARTASVSDTSAAQGQCDGPKQFTQGTYLRRFRRGNSVAESALVSLDVVRVGLQALGTPDASSLCRLDLGKLK